MLLPRSQLKRFKPAYRELARRYFAYRVRRLLLKATSWNARGLAIYSRAFQSTRLRFFHVFFIVRVLFHFKRWRANLTIPFDCFPSLFGSSLNRNSFRTRARMRGWKNGWKIDGGTREKRRREGSGRERRISESARVVDRSACQSK